MRFIIKILFIVCLLATNVSCNELKKNEIAKIQFNSYGCFGSEHNELTLFEADGLTKAKLEIKEDTVYFADIDQQGLEYFYKFVNELKAVKKSGYCTTILTCTIHTEDETIEKTGIDCQWDGFEYLKAALFKDQRIGKVLRYEEKMSDSTIKFDFSIRYGNYDFYFNVAQVNSWCDRMLSSKDGLEPFYKSIKQEVNREPEKYISDNHLWLMTLFTPRIVNVNTKEEGKSLLVKQYDSLSAERSYFVITPQNDTIIIFDSRARSF